MPKVKPSRSTNTHTHLLTTKRDVQTEPMRRLPARPARRNLSALPVGGERNGGLPQLEAPELLEGERATERHTQKGTDAEMRELDPCQREADTARRM